MKHETRRKEETTGRDSLMNAVRKREKEREREMEAQTDIQIRGYGISWRGHVHLQECAKWQQMIMLRPVCHGQDLENCAKESKRRS